MTKKISLKRGRAAEGRVAGQKTHKQIKQMRKEATAEFHQISMPAFQSPSVRRSRFARIPGEVVGCASEDAQSTEPNRPSSLRVRILTAILRTFTTLRTAFTPLLAQETTAHDRQARHQTSTVLLLLGWGLLWRRLLVAHGRLLVAILLGWGWAVAGLLLVLAWGRAVVVSRVSKVRVLTFERLRDLAQLRQSWC